jgi:hypothetical protein
LGGGYFAAGRLDLAPIAIGKCASRAHLVACSGATWTFTQITWRLVIANFTCSKSALYVFALTFTPAGHEQLPPSTPRHHDLSKRRATCAPHPHVRELHQCTRTTRKQYSSHRKAYRVLLNSGCGRQVHRHETSRIRGWRRNRCHQGDSSSG